MTKNLPEIFNLGAQGLTFKTLKVKFLIPMMQSVSKDHS